MKYTVKFMDMDKEIYGIIKFDTLEDARDHIKAHLESCGLKDEVSDALNVWTRYTITTYDCYGDEDVEVEYYRVSTI